MPPLRPSSLLLLAGTIAGPAAAAPSLVTASSGTVLLDGAAAPAVPFLVADDARLELGADGEIVVLVAGIALRRAGAGLVELAVPDGTAGASSLPGLLQRQVDSSRAGATKGPAVHQTRTSRSGATRAGGVNLRRPVAGAELLQLDHVQWSCAPPCADVSVHLRSALDGTTAWSGTGAGDVEIPPLSLAPGLWELVIGGDSFALQFPDTDRAAELTAALADADAAAAALPAADRVGQASVRAGVRWQLGLPSDALGVLDAALQAAPDPDRPALQALLDRYEAQALP